MRLWYKDAIIYAVDVERFYDADEDGYGDFKGLIEKLDYLEDLGVNTLWLLPFNPTPNKDNGYDISNYYGVDTRLGTAGDFVEFITAARNKGIRVICDLVVNHTSDEHPWFTLSKKRVPRYEDYYVWKKAPEDDGKPAFPEQEESVWEHDSTRDEHYYHTFYKFMPDLNLANPLVMEEIEKIMAFWIELGAMGFRIDGAAPMTRPAKGRHDHAELFKDFRKRLRWRRGDAVLLAEADDTPERLPRYAADGDGAQVLFNFILNAHVWHALARREAEPLVGGLRLTPPLGGDSTYANFLRNLDELNLARIPSHAKDEVIEALAPDGDVRIFERGIRRRLAPLLGDDPGRLRLANSILFSLPGVPVLVYGDEIGMGDDLSLDGREAVRTAMQWSDEDNGGFTAADPKVPLIRGEGYGYTERNVRKLIQDEDSLFHYVRTLARLRRRSPVLTRGSFQLLDSGSRTVAAWAYTNEDAVLYCVHNLGESEQRLSWEDLDRQTPDSKPLEEAEELHSDDDYRASSKTLRINANGYRWILLRRA